MTDRSGGEKPNKNESGDAQVCLSLLSSGLTDVGKVRESNQDHFLVARLSECLEVVATNLPKNVGPTFVGRKQGDFFCVADGMGGHAAGERASQMAVEFFAQHLLSRAVSFLQTPMVSETELQQHFTSLLRDAHVRILGEAALFSKQRGMGTTLTMALVIGNTMHVVHAGDSRCYLIRDGEARLITTDHTLARKMVESGELNPEKENQSRWSNVLWNVLGGQIEGDLVAEIHQVNLLPNDTIVLCSDGLYQHVDNAVLAMTVCEGDNPQTICEQLIQMANDAGGSDNITVIVALVKGRRDSTGQTTLMDDTITTDDLDLTAGESVSFGEVVEHDTTLIDKPPPA